MVGLSPAAATRRWPLVAAAAALLALALALRLGAATGDLWLDEIWTLDLVQARAPSPAHVFWSIQHDNNHPLYSLWAWFLPDHPAPWLYRLPAILSGALAVAAAGLIGARRGTAGALFAMLLVAVSYPLVHYGSEARGYGPMTACVLAAFWLVDGDMRRGAIARGAGHRGWIALALGAGFLFHMTAALSALALGLWVAVEAWRETGSIAAARRRARTYFLPSLAVFLAILAVFAAALLANGYEIGSAGEAGGFAARYAANVGALVGLMFGLPVGRAPALVLAAVALAAGAAIAFLWRQGDARARFYAIAIFLLPGSLFALGLPGPAFGRYYLFGLVFLLPLAADMLALSWRAGIAGKVSSLALTFVMLAGSGLAYDLFRDYGRGDYGRAVAYLAAETQGPDIAVGSDHDFRNRTLLDYYAPVMAPGRAIAYVPRDALAAKIPEWLIVHRVRRPGAAPEPPAPDLKIGASTYRLVRVSLHWGLSGFDWLIYRRAAAPRS